MAKVIQFEEAKARLLLEQVPPAKLVGMKEQEFEQMFSRLGERLRHGGTTKHGNTKR